MQSAAAVPFWYTSTVCQPKFAFLCKERRKRRKDICLDSLLKYVSPPLASLEI